MGERRSAAASMCPAGFAKSARIWSNVSGIATATVVA
jgi:hypothetical protein